MASIKYKDANGKWVPLPTVVSFKGQAELPALSNPAQPSDVAEGKQYINQDGVAATGTYEKYTLPTLTNPATAAQVVEGADFVNKNGARQVGTMPVVDSIEGVKITSIAKGSSGQITASGSAFTAASTFQAVYPNTDIEVPISLSGFGNATAADVMRGKTFTSSNGLKLTGTWDPTPQDFNEARLNYNSSGLIEFDSDINFQLGDTNVAGFLFILGACTISGYDYKGCFYFGIIDPQNSQRFITYRLDKQTLYEGTIQGPPSDWSISLGNEPQIVDVFYKIWENPV